MRGNKKKLTLNEISSTEEIKNKLKKEKEKLEEKGEEKKVIFYSFVWSEGKSKKVENNIIDEIIRLIESKEKKKEELGIKLADLLIHNEKKNNSIGEIEKYISIDENYRDLAFAVITYHENKKNMSFNFFPSTPVTPIPRVIRRQKEKEKLDSIYENKTKKSNLTRELNLLDKKKKNEKNFILKQEILFATIIFLFLICFVLLRKKKKIKHF